MSIQILRDLRGLRVQVIHPPDGEGVSLVEHLRRIGCSVEAQWPVPEAFASTADVVLLAVDSDSRDAIRKLLKTVDGIPPTIIAIVGYENPSTLQLVLEAGALAVIERPVRPFGLLTHLTLARSLWMERQDAERRVRKLERKLAGIQKIQRAKSILIANQGLSEEDAYATIRQQAMAKRIPMEEMASAIINANDLLTYRGKGD
ncbi:ANTAR domain-containing protein [Pseudoxanthobacter sp. M-2]|uniref:ANTAR domain-containing response regulator n=1 Tax=Pseudoxanthobacter sp. M-2 TaxID=3078754 RepID=UPI0038FC75C8